MGNILVKAPKLDITRPEVVDVYFAKKIEENGKVGNYKNKEGTATQAIAEIMLGFDNKEDSCYYIFSKENRLYVTLSIEANNEGKSDKTICYNLKEYKYNYTDDPNFWYRKNRFVLEEPPVAPWMEIAWEEYYKWKNGNWTEKEGKGFDVAKEYVDKAKGGFNPNEKPWCACFVDWILKITNEKKQTNFSTVQIYPASSQNYINSVRYPNSQVISPSLNKPSYGVFAVLHSSGWSGHIGFVVNFVTKENKNYIHILGGNQNDKVCVQEFEVFENKGNIIFKTKKGSKYTLKGYVYPKEYNLPLLEDESLNYKTKGYEVESAISTT